MPESVVTAIASGVGRARPPFRLITSAACGLSLAAQADQNVLRLFG
jgi:hypothetical protein